MAKILKVYLIGSTLLIFARLCFASFDTGLSDTQMQGVLKNYFPISEYAAFARVSLHEPQVRLTKDNKDIVLIIPVAANLTDGGLRQGHVTVLINLSYKPASGGLYLSQPRVEHIEIPGVSAKVLADLRNMIESMAQNSLPLIRVYSVKERDLNHSLAKSALKSFAIEDGRMHLEFGFQ